MQHINIQTEHVPVLGYGTWQLKGKGCIEGIQKAIDAGYRHIDTAQAYGNEEDVGKGIDKSGIERQEIFLTTKVWMENFSADKFEKSVDESLDKLQTDYVNMLLLHWPPENDRMEEALDQLIEVKKSGKARLIGVSNFTIELLERAVKKTNTVIATNQIEFHPEIDQGPVHEWLRRHNMFLTGYSPLARGGVLKNHVIEKIAKHHDKDAGQVVLRWAIQHDRVAVIPKAASPEHIESNFDIFDFELSNEEMDKISSLAREDGRKVDPEWAPDWDTAKAA
ncbi:MAG: aldo/keto reductase [Alphaproteobacteria bacterium]|nr:aldo/keto reductase [Alphaproteobacteria bacterium]